MSVESLTLKGDLGSRNLSISTRNETVQVRTLWGVVVRHAAAPIWGMFAMYTGLLGLFG